MGNVNAKKECNVYLGNKEGYILPFIIVIIITLLYYYYYYYVMDGHGRPI
jgi:hypothetical protein